MHRRAILERGEWDLTAVAEQFARWLRGNLVDVGSTCRRGIRDYILKRQLSTPPNEWDAGNGAAMRVAPVALFALGDEELISRLAVEQARLTHNHPLSDSACVTVARMVQRAVLGTPIAGLRAAAEELAGRHAEFRFDGDPGGPTAYVADTLRTVFHDFFSTRTFEECLVRVVNRGGDADTTGAIAGAIAGAHYGLEVVKSPKLYYVLLFMRLQDKYSGLGTPWGAGAIMNDNDQGVYFYEITTDQITRFRDFNDAWLQYQFVATTSSRKVLGRSPVYQDDISITHCPSPTPTQAPPK